MDIRNQKGSLLILTYIVIFVLISLGTVFSLFALNEARSVERARRTAIALNIAEAGIERAVMDLRSDYVNDSTPSWTDSNINGYLVGPDTADYYLLTYDGDASTPMTPQDYLPNLNGGSYQVWLKNVTGTSREIWVKSVGTFGDQTQTIRVYLRMVSISPWDNAIFAGGGAAGRLINGNVNIRGSVHILGTGLSSSDYAVDLGGTAELVGNNYNSLSSSLRAKVPALPTTVVNGETVETLNAELRVKHGKVGLSGSSTVGEPNVTGADGSGYKHKELIDASYVTDGFGGTKGSANVYSDNGWSNAYDLGDSMTYPRLSDPIGGYTDFYDYFDNSGGAPLEINSDITITPATSATYTLGSNQLIISSGNITINGKVKINGTLTMDKDGSDETLTYSGTGTILTTGNVQINANLVTSGSNSYPTNIMAVMTPASIGFNRANIDVMGLFYSDYLPSEHLDGSGNPIPGGVKVEKQTDVMGTIVAQYFDMGTNVPSIFQVPEVVNNLPIGLIGGSSVWVMRDVSWQKCDNFADPNCD